MIVSKLQHSLWIHPDVKTCPLSDYLWGEFIANSFTGRTFSTFLQSMPTILGGRNNDTY